MTTQITVTFDTTRKQRAHASYSLHLADVDTPVTGRLIQNGPVYNGRVSYVGTFDTPGAAAVAALAYYGMPGQVVQMADPVTGDLSHALTPFGRLPRMAAWRDLRVLASRSSAGTYVAS